jgi:hypothetical protein
VIEVNFI